ncbi:N-acetyltransferase [Aureitalea sp. L0-47]|uniref:GNAT family N-acetyltransferase n=1 Tax=Aureitalea sp. L0-47 TaxID=2816962 RepID=UPI002238E33D|nr:GNAT family N-acetyltransferase [Aureitalea sp. L0-47]MCW5519852.1 N-acetyltransferase [Aureitalea sp. L0-47]
MDIEPCTIRDYQVVAEIYNEYISDGNATMEENYKSAADIAKWVADFNDRERLYSLKKEEKVIGWGIIKRYSERGGYRFTAETAIYITTEELRKGYGSEMKRFLIDQCRDLGYHHLVAKVFAHNEASIKYNMELGYTIVGTQKEVGFKNDRWVDVVIMQYLIN